MGGTTYWHGGAPGLRPGDVIEPRADGDTRHLVDDCPTCEARRVGAQLADDPNDARQVYVTTERDYAKVFAAGYPRGWLYRVEPVGDMQRTDDDPVPSWAVGSCRVVSVYERCVTLTAARAASLLRRFTRAAADR